MVVCFITSQIFWQKHEHHSWPNWRDRGGLYGVLATKTDLKSMIYREAVRVQSRIAKWIVWVELRRLISPIREKIITWSKQL